MATKMTVYDSGALIPFAGLFCICRHVKGQHKLMGTGGCDNCNCNQFRLAQSMTQAEADELRQRDLELAKENTREEILAELKGAMCVVPSEAATPIHTSDSELSKNAVLAKKSLRTSVLEEANSLVTGDRNNTYGEPHQDFSRTAGALTALGYRGPDGREIQAHDVAIIVGVVKISRLMWTPTKRDSWVDLAGYAACGYEAAELTLNEGTG